MQSVANYFSSLLRSILPGKPPQISVCLHQLHKSADAFVQHEGLHTHLQQVGIGPVPSAVFIQI